MYENLNYKLSETYIYAIENNVQPEETPKLCKIMRIKIKPDDSVYRKYCTNYRLNFFYDRFVFKII